MAKICPYLALGIRIHGLLRSEIVLISIEVGITLGQVEYYCTTTGSPAQANVPCAAYAHCKIQALQAELFFVSLLFPSFN